MKHRRPTPSYLVIESNDHESIQYRPLQQPPFLDASTGMPVNCDLNSDDPLPDSLLFDVAVLREPDPYRAQDKEKLRRVSLRKLRTS